MGLEMRSFCLLGMSPQEKAQGDLRYREARGRRLWEQRGKAPKPRGAMSHLTRNRQGRLFPESIWRNLLTARFQASGLQNWEEYISVTSSHPVCGDLLRQQRNMTRRLKEQDPDAGTHSLVFFPREWVRREVLSEGSQLSV